MSCWQEVLRGFLPTVILVIMLGNYDDFLMRWMRWVMEVFGARLVVEPSKWVYCCSIMWFLFHLQRSAVNSVPKRQREYFLDHGMKTCKIQNFWELYLLIVIVLISTVLLMGLKQLLLLRIRVPDNPESGFRIIWNPDSMQTTLKIPCSKIAARVTQQGSSMDFLVLLVIFGSHGSHDRRRWMAK